MGCGEKEERPLPHITMRNYCQANPYEPRYAIYPFGIDFEGLPFYYVNKRNYDPRTAKPFGFVSLKQLKWYCRQPSRRVPRLDQFPGPLSRLRGHMGEKKRKGTFVPDPFRHCTPTVLLSTKSVYTRKSTPYVKRPTGKM
jgi:hypothetical protein